MTTWTPEAKSRLVTYLDSHSLAAGPVSDEGICSLVAINMAIDGRLTDLVPDCMSSIIGNWIVGIQDEMLHEMRNSLEWKELLPSAVGTGHEREVERSNMIHQWVWEKVIPLLTELLEPRFKDKFYIHDAWLNILEARTASVLASMSEYLDFDQDFDDIVCTLMRYESWFDTYHLPFRLSDPGSTMEAGILAGEVVKFGRSQDIMERWQRLDPIGLLADLCME